jgi:hypothetical protein
MLAREQVERLDAYGLGPRAGREDDRVALEDARVDECLAVEQSSEHGVPPSSIEGKSLCSSSSEARCADGSASTFRTRRISSRRDAGMTATACRPLVSITIALRSDPRRRWIPWTSSSAMVGGSWWSTSYGTPLASR